MFKGINWIAVIVAVVLVQVLGFLWYGPLFGAMWHQLNPTAPMSSSIRPVPSVAAPDQWPVPAHVALPLARVGDAGHATAAGDFLERLGHSAPPSPGVRTVARPPGRGRLLFRGAAR